MSGKRRSAPVVISVEEVRGWLGKAWRNRSTYGDLGSIASLKTRIEVVAYSQMRPPPSRTTKAANGARQFLLHLPRRRDELINGLPLLELISPEDAERVKTAIVEADDIARRLEAVLPVLLPPRPQEPDPIGWIGKAVENFWLSVDSGAPTYIKARPPSPLCKFVYLALERLEMSPNYHTIAEALRGRRGRAR